MCVCVCVFLSVCLSVCLSVSVSSVCLYLSVSVEFSCQWIMRFVLAFPHCFGSFKVIQHMQLRVVRFKTKALPFVLL